MAKCTGLSVVRDENNEAIRDYVTRVPLMRPCKNGAIRGIDKCVIHCTALERQKSMQATFMHRHGREISNLMFSLDLDMNPMDGLLEAVRICGTMTRVFQVLTSELPEAPFVETTVSRTGDLVDTEHPGIYGHDHNKEQAPHIFLTQLQMWVDRYARACKMALDAGIDERLVRNAESTSTVFLSAFDRALKSMALSDDVKRNLAEVMAREVRAGIAGTTNQMEVLTR
jgi:hypothetical protein